jgi:3,4-dihydroxy 2-butanone 4-phosphate synthase/GTP cyclohydrolase II
LARPGHVFPLRARAGGVIERPGHTEAAVDFAKLLNKRPAGVICEIMNDDGTMARRPDLEVYCQRHNFVMTSVAQLVEYQKQRATNVDAHLSAVAY